MRPIATAWSRLRALIAQRRAQLRLGVRVTVSALLTLAIGQWLHVPLVLWAVLTAVIVTQTSVGRSLKATIDYFIGTLGGAVYAGTVAALIPHTSEAALLGVLALAVAPLALLAASNSSFNVAPATAIIVVLAPTFTHSTPVESAFFRLIEVALGATTGLAVSLTVLPARAHAFAIEAAAGMLDLVAQALQDLLAGFIGGLDASAIRPMQERIGKAIARLDVICAEANRERMTQLADAPDPGPLLRTLLRLRHDLVIVGRAAVDPLPQALQPRLAPPLARLGAAASGYLRDCATALTRRAVPPTLDAADAAFADYAAEIAAIRREGLTRALPGDALEHLFTLRFALEELHQHLRDLQKWVTEWARPPKLARREEME
ncbi:MAG TPA: FUSC family protein [Xanthobacteraceae bacterium]